MTMSHYSILNADNFYKLLIAYYGKSDKNAFKMSVQLDEMMIFHIRLSDTID